MNTSLSARIADLPDSEQMVLRMLHRRLNAPHNKLSIDFKFVGMVNGALDKALSRDGRMEFYRWVFASDIEGNPAKRQINSSHDLHVSEMYALVLWAGPHKDPQDGKWKFSDEFNMTMELLTQLFSGGVGQPALPGTERIKKNLRELGYDDK